MPLSSRLRGYLELARPHNVFVAVLNGLVGVATVWAYVSHCVTCLRECIYALISIAFVSAAGYAINDYFDLDIDRLNKPWRPIPSGRVTPGEAHVYSLLLFALGVYAGFQASLYNGLYALAVSILLYLYPAWMKRRHALTGHLTVALTGASTILYGGIAAGACVNALFEAVKYSLVPTLYAFTLILAREFVKALEDYEADAAMGASTIATTYGVNAARVAASLLLALVAAASPLPVLIGYSMFYLSLALIVAALSIYSIILVVRGEYAAARRLLKIAFGVGGLAFLLDPLLRLAGMV